MGFSFQLRTLLLYALCSSVISQSQERQWHSTTKTFAPSTSRTKESSTEAPSTGQPSTVPATPTPPSTDLPTAAPASTGPPTQPPSTAQPSTVPSSSPTPEAESGIPDSVKESSPILLAESLGDTKGSGKATKHVNNRVEEVLETLLTDVEDDKNLQDSVALERRPSNENKQGKKSRMWMSISTPAPAEEENISSTVAEDSELPSNDSSEASVEEEVAIVALNATNPASELPKNKSDLPEDDLIPMVLETIISKKTTVYVTYTEAISDVEPVYVNLTGIRDFTGVERRIVGGCLDLSDLFITGEEAREIILRMSKQKFHRLDLSNNNISELPTNTFSSVAFTVRELRLDGNPLLSNSQGEGGSLLQRGGLFHLTELRELNLSRCGLQDMDFFTPWNSNHLEVVDLSCNNLRRVPTNLQFFHKLKKLLLDGNPITEIGELPFALLWNLQLLSLNSCQVTSITSDPFRNMERLKELALDGNNLTRIGDVRIPRSSSGVKLWLSSNPWHCACDMLSFIEHYHYAIRDIEEIRCASPRWLEGLRTAYLTKEILSLDSVDGDCTPSRYDVPPLPVIHHYTSARTDHLEVLALLVFVLAAAFMLLHVLWSKKKDKYKLEDDRDDIKYIRIDKKPSFK